MFQAVNIWVTAAPRPADDQNGGTSPRLRSRSRSQADPPARLMTSQGPGVTLNDFGELSTLAFTEWMMGEIVQRPIMSEHRDLDPATACRRGGPRFLTHSTTCGKICETLAGSSPVPHCARVSTGLWAAMALLGYRSPRSKMALPVATLQSRPEPAG